jgi:hypothetical protein
MLNKHQTHKTCPKNCLKESEESEEKAKEVEAEEHTELPVTLKTLLNAVQFYDLCCAKSNHQILKQEPIPDSTLHYSQLVSQQEYEFVHSLDQEEIKNLFEFADYIDFGMLRRLMAKTIAFKIKQCKHVEDIRKHLGILNDFDPEEYAKLEDDSKCLH